ncbi:MAG: hypothetical protein ACRDYX_17840 [Egibacteraceae bacterium]
MFALLNIGRAAIDDLPPGARLEVTGPDSTVLCLVYEWIGCAYQAGIVTWLCPLGRYRDTMCSSQTSATAEALRTRLLHPSIFRICGASLCHP